MGQVSPDLISSYFTPKIQELASESAVRYAGELLDYEDAVKEVNGTGTAEAEAEIGIDGSVETGAEEPPVPPAKPLFHSQHRIDELTELFADTSEYFFAKSGGWKVHANAAKFERSLDEKYGIFRPFITEHPEIEQFVRSVQRRYATGYFSPIRQGPPPIPRSTAIILLFMMHRGKMGWQMLLLAVLFFLVGLQPWALVVAISLVQGLLYRRKRRTIGKMKRRIPAIDPYYRGGKKEDYLLKPVGTPLGVGEQIETANYDTIMIGYGTSTLYAAALLSRAGRKVLVLSSATDASGCLTFQNNKKLENVPFDVQSSNIPRISRQQRLLAPALATNTDYQGGIRFATIGSEADGYAFEILSIPGVGTEGRDQEAPFVLKAAGGVTSLMEDTATYLGDNWPATDDGPGDSMAGQYVQACEKINASASLFYLTKVLPESVNKMRSDTEYKSAALRNCTGMLNGCFQLNAHLRSLMAGIGMKGENLTPSQTCMAAHVTNVCGSISPEGMHYPLGGPRALGHALVNSIEQSGGRVVTGAAAIELIFDESIKVAASQSDKKDDEPQAPCCVGVQVSGGQEIRFSADRYNKGSDIPVVVSMEGFIHTFIRLLPDDIRTTYKVPRGIPALSERRPVVHLLFALKGSASDLSITGADYYRLPGAAIATDEVDPVTGETKFGEIGWSDQDSDETKEDEQADIVENTNKENEETTKTSEVRRKKKRSFKFETGQSWIRISFPSAKDPTFEDRHGKVTTCVVTIEADDDLVTPYDTKPKIFVIKRSTAASTGELQRLSERVKKDLFGLYPQLEGESTGLFGVIQKSFRCTYPRFPPFNLLSGNILHAEIRGPFQKGLSHSPERYAAKGVRVDTPYPGLYAGGPDLTVGDSFSGSTVAGWLVANSVCGYNAVDHLFLQKNITTDLEQFLEPPTLADEEDVAVPFSPPAVPLEEDETAENEA